MRIEMRIAAWGGNGHTRWELPHEMRIATWDENCHARWEWSHEMRIAMRDENCHARWELPCEVGMVTQDENCHVRWELPRKVGMFTRDTSHLVKFFTPWYFNTIHKFLYAMTRHWFLQETSSMFFWNKLCWLRNRHISRLVCAKGLHTICHRTHGMLSKNRPVLCLCENPGSRNEPNLGRWLSKYKHIK